MKRRNFDFFLYEATKNKPLDKNGRKPDGSINRILLVHGMARNCTVGSPSRESENLSH